MNLTIRQGYVNGCIGRIAGMHADFYSRLVAFGLPFEARVARELANFCEEHQPGRDGLWLAMDGEMIHGSVVIDGAHAKEQGAHLRWFIASDAARGTGIGSKLMEHAMAHCVAQGFARVHLSTFEGLDAARHLYEKHGFRLVHQRAGAQWGKEVNEQRFEWQLPASHEIGVKG